MESDGFHLDRGENNDDGRCVGALLARLWSGKGHRYAKQAPSAKDLALDMLIVYIRLSLLLRLFHFILFDL